MSILPINFAIKHIKGRQDDFKLSKDLTIEEYLNIDADKIATTCVKLPLNIHFPSTPFVTNIKGEYIHLLSHKIIREFSFEDDAKHFIQNKYKLNSLTLQDIDWNLHSTQFNKIPPSGKHSVARFIHHRLPSSIMMFEAKHRCPFYAMNTDATTDHDDYHKNK